MFLVQLGEGISEIETVDGDIIKFESPLPIGAKPNNKNELWVFYPSDYFIITDYKPKNMRQYINFNGKRPDKLLEINISDEGLYPIAKVKRTNYLSDKEGEEYIYTHTHKKPYPTLYTNKDNTLFVIKGGKFTIGKKRGYDLAWLFD